jgi:23S rRNA pseudoU1915 N3-methylase RlmH
MGRRAPRLQIACVGRLRPPLDAAGRLYEERVDRMAGLRVDEVAAEPLQRGEERARAAEAERLRARLLPRALRVALDPDGRAPASSPAFAAWPTGPSPSCSAARSGWPRGCSPSATSACPSAR